MNEPNALAALSGADFQFAFCAALNQAHIVTMPFHQRGNINAPDQGVDIEGNLDGKLHAYQCKTGPVGKAQIDKEAKSLKAYPHKIDFYALVCSQSPTGDSWHHFESIKHKFVTAMGPIEQVELWGPDYILSKLALQFSGYFRAPYVTRMLNTHRESLAHEFKNSAPSLGKPPLASIYIDGDCGFTTWGELRDSAAHGDAFKINPFDEQASERFSLFDRTLALIEDPKVRDFIVIQGTPGAGKSTFTIKLALTLTEQGHSAIRVRLREISIQEDSLKAIAESLDMQKGDLLQILTGGSGLRVLILDGWDELTLAANADFSQRVSLFLHSLRTEILNKFNGNVAVVLTGRPSLAVTGNENLKASTPILTIWRFTPNQLRDYFSKLTPHYPNSSNFEDICALYERDWLMSQTSESHKMFGTFDVIGWPHLANLAFQLLVECAPSSRQELVQDRTMLLRCLTEYYCKHSRNPSDNSATTEIMTRLTPTELREFVHKVAIAITHTGSEYLDFDSLNKVIRDQNFDTAKQIPLLVTNNLLKTELKHKGCEFLHKSLREFAFAEALIDYLKTLAATPNDYRQKLKSEISQGEALAKLLAPRWITREVWSNIQDLIAWEIKREDPKKDDPPAFRRSIPPLGIAGWCQVRDRLTALWNDWAIHALPPPKPKPSSLKDKITEENERVERTRYDSRIGDALFQLCATLHGLLALYLINQKQRLNLQECTWIDREPLAINHPHQTSLMQNDPAFHPDLRFFSPFNDGSQELDEKKFLRAAMAQINTHRVAAGEELPSRCDLTFLTLIAASLDRFNFELCDLTHAYLGQSSLIGANFQNSEVTNASFHKTDCRGANFYNASLNYTSFVGANLQGAIFVKAELPGTDFTAAKGLTVEQILAAKNWQSAIFDPNFKEELVYAQATTNADSSTQEKVTHSSYVRQYAITELYPSSLE